MGQAGSQQQLAGWMTAMSCGECSVQENQICVNHNARFAWDAERPPAVERSLLNSIIISASSKGKVPALQAALDAGADVEARTAAGGVIYDGPEDVIEAEPQFEWPGVPEHCGKQAPDCCLEPCRKGPTPLMRAARGGHCKAAALLLERRASPHARDERGMTALHFAAAAASFDTCMALLRAGATRWALDLEGRDAFAHLPSGALQEGDHQRWEQVLRPGGEWCRELTSTKLQLTPRAAEGTQQGCSPVADSPSSPAPDSPSNLEVPPECTGLPAESRMLGRPRRAQGEGDV